MVSTNSESKTADMPAAVNARPRVLVTGATGRIGRHVVSELLQRRYRVRALTSKPIETVTRFEDNLEWRQFDWHHSLSFEPLVEGCDIVLHLGAELHRIENMQRSNVDVVRALARASEQAGVKFFCYTSSVAVYGSSLNAVVTEDSPVLTCDRDVKGEFFADENLRAYGRTKLAGERAIHEEAKRGTYIILRPTVVVDVPDLMELCSWSYLKKAVAGYRRSHQIYVLDVVHAILWFMDEHLAKNRNGCSVDVYNLSNDDFANNTYAHFFHEAFRRTSDRRFNSIELPSIFDRIRNAVRFGILPRRHLLGAMFFSPEKLYSTGYRHRYGVKELHERAINALASEQDSSEQNKSS